jgi:UDP-glucose 4-epimerase
LKILITGGLGNLGSSLISYLTNLKGIEIVVVDNHNSNKSKIAEKYSRKNNINFMDLELAKTGNNFLINAFLPVKIILLIFSVMVLILFWKPQCNQS